jgi:hypothetical protein
MCEGKDVFVKCLFSEVKNDKEIVFLNAQNKRVDANINGTLCSKILIHKTENEDTITLSFIQNKPFYQLPPDHGNVYLSRTLQPDIITRQIRYIYSNGTLIKKEGDLVYNLGYSQIIYRYDDKGRQIEQISLDIDGNLVNHNIGYDYAKKQFFYDDKNLLALTYLSENGNKTELKYQYLNTDTIVTQMWYESNGARMVKPESSGIGEIKDIYKKGEQITSYYDLNGHPINYMYDEYYTCECASQIKRILKDGSTEELFLDTLGKQIKKVITPLNAEETNSSYNPVYKYDNNGNVLEIKYYDSLGNPTTNYDTIHRTVYIRNAQGMINQVLSYGLNNERCGNSEKIEFDSIGRILVVSNYDFQDNLILDRRLGFAKYSYQYDANGNVIEYKTYGTDGSLMGNENGVACYKYKYDDMSNLIEFSTYDYSIEFDVENELDISPITRFKISYNYKDSSFTVEKFNSDNILNERCIYNKNNDLLQRFDLYGNCSQLLETVTSKVGYDGRIIEQWITDYDLKKCTPSGYQVFYVATNEELNLSLKKKPMNFNGWYRHDLTSDKYYNTKGVEVFYDVELRKWK